MTLPGENWVTVDTQSLERRDEAAGHCPRPVGLDAALPWAPDPGRRDTGSISSARRLAVPEFHIYRMLAQKSSQPSET